MRKIIYGIIFLLLLAALFFSLYPTPQKTSYVINDSHMRDTKAVYQRIEFIVIHFTHGGFEESLGHLKHGPVSNTIYRLVGDDAKAAHAGVSYWQGFTRLNSSSIGIELINLGYDDKGGVRHWYPYSEYQINLLISLLHDLIEQYEIDPHRIVGHSDITQNLPERGGNIRVDPGPLFPWERLADAGIGAWYDADEVEEIIDYIEGEPLDIESLQQNLATYGYKIEVTGKLDQQTKNVVQAFQMHFRPDNYDGVPDDETYAIAENLVEKYF